MGLFLNFCGLVTVIKMTEEWVLFWYQCLSENSEYSSYCRAVECGDCQTMRAQEERFPLIHEIYADFGPTFGWPLRGLDDPMWKEWFEPRRHLFMYSIQEVTERNPASRPGHLTINVPLAADLAEVETLFKRFIQEIATDQNRERAPAPKYQLHTTRGRVACGYQQVRQAVHTSTVSYTFDPETFEYVTIEQAMVQFLKNEVLTMGWSIKNSTYKTLVADGTINPDEFEGFKVRINKCRRDFVALSRNTLRGRFPDLTPFEGDVMDQFWGE